MTAASNVQVRFTGGEWSKSAQGRMDDPRYRTAMNLCQNILPLVEGSSTRRFGTRQVARTRGGVVGRIMPYILGSDEAYNIELTDGHMRFFQNGVLLTAGAVSVSNIATSTYVAVTATAHGLATDDVVTFVFETEIARLKFAVLTNRRFLVHVHDADTFEILSEVSRAHLTDSFSAFDSATDTVLVERIVDLETPYDNSEWTTVRVLQSDERTVLLQGSVQPQEITTESIEPANFIDGPYLDPVEGSWITPDNLSGIVNFVLSFQTYDAAVAYSEGDYVTSSGVAYRSLVSENQGNTPASSPTQWEITAASAVVNDGAGFGNSDAGRHVRFLSEPPLWVTGTSYVAGNVVTFADTYWTALTTMAGATPPAGDVNPNQPGVKDTTWAPNPAAAQWVWGKIVADATIPGLIDPTTGTTVETFTGTGSAAFDGNTLQLWFNGGGGSPTCASSGSSPRYIGKNWATASAISSVKVYPSANYGFVASGVCTNSSTSPPTLNGGGSGDFHFTINLRAKHTAPSSSSDGTLLGTTGSVANTVAAQTITSNDQTTLWEYVWIEATFTQNDFLVSEVQFYSAASPAGAGVAVQIIGAPLLYTSTIRTWRLGVYNNYEPRWPTNGCYHEGRFWLASAVPNRFDASMSNKPFTFSPTATDGTVADNNAITYVLNSQEKNTILWMKPEVSGILMGTSGAAVLVRAPTPGGMSPTNITANPVTAYGCADIDPVNAGLTTVFVHQYQRQLHEQMRDAYSGAIVSPEITDLANNLTVGGVQEITMTKALQPIVWARTGEGTLVGATYRRSNLISSEPPEVNAWHRHPLGNEDNTVVSISRAPSLAGNLDTLAMIVEDEAGIHHVMFGSRFPEEDDTIYQADYVDCGIVPSCGEHYTSETGIRFHGLWGLNGHTVCAWIGGLDCGDYVVSDGYIEVPYGSASGLFTKRFVIQLSAQAPDVGDLATPVDNGTFVIPAIVGYPFVSRGQTLRPAASDATGAQNGPGFGKTRRAHGVGVMIHNTQGLYLGTTFEKMRPALFKTPGGRRYTAIELFSGIWEDTLDDDNSLDGMLAWETRRPYPTRMLAIGGFLATQDK